MLGVGVSDPEGVEGGGEAKGLGLLPVMTVLAGDKRTEQFKGRFCDTGGLFAGLSGLEIEGYEIHMGKTFPDGCIAQCASGFTSDDTGVCEGSVYGTYIHGIFDREGVAAAVVNALAEKKGVSLSGGDASGHREFKEREYDRLAAILRENLDVERIYSMLREAAF